MPSQMAVLERNLGDKNNQQEIVKLLELLEKEKVRADDHLREAEKYRRQLKDRDLPAF